MSALRCVSVVKTALNIRITPVDLIQNEKRQLCNLILAKKLSLTCRYIDNIIALNNDGLFDNIMDNIYLPMVTKVKQGKYRIQWSFIVGSVKVKTRYSTHLFMINEMLSHLILYIFPTS